MASRHSATRRRQRLVAAGVVSALVIGIAWWVSRDTDSDSGPDLPAVGSEPADPTTDRPAKKRKTKKAKDVEFRTPSGTATPADIAGLGELGDLPGLPGGTLADDVPPLDLTITLTSASPIGTVGWVIPTSRSDSHGQADGIGRSWSLSTRVYGRPDYARVFLQAGPTGDPITCVISVEGRVTERRATVGPYGAMMCQG